MLYAEWEGRHVTVRRQDRAIVRKFTARYDVVGVQCSGNDTNDGMVAISMTGGKTDLYKADGTLVRKGM